MLLMLAQMLLARGQAIVERAEIPHGVDDVVSPQRAEPVCEHLQQIFQSSAQRANHFVVYRCRRQDVCGGWGDQVAGIIGAAFLAVSLGRAFRVDFAEIQSVFSVRHAEWLYNSSELGISQQDAVILDRAAIDRHGQSPFPDPTFSGLSKEIGVVNALNSIRFQTFEMQRELEQHRIVIYIGNRGISGAWYRRWVRNYGTNRSSHWIGWDWMKVYRCLWNYLFVPQREFLLSGVGMLNGTSQPLGHMLSMISSGLSHGIVLQVRVRGSGSGPARYIGVEALDDFSVYLEDCIKKKIRQTSDTSKTVITVLSNSRIVGDAVASYFHSKDPLVEVWTHKVSGNVHTDRTYALRPNDVSEVQLAFKDAMIDWLLMQHASILLFDPSSGFPTSAALLGLPAQKHYFLYTCTRQYRQQFCYGRFCGPLEMK